MASEKKKIRPVGKRELDLVVGGGAYSTNFIANFISNSNWYTDNTNGYTYQSGFMKDQQGGYIPHGIGVTAGPGVAAGWGFDQGFPTQNWANNWAGGASNFKNAFIQLYGAGNWKGWGSNVIF